MKASAFKPLRYKAGRQKNSTGTLLKFVQHLSDQLLLFTGCVLLEDLLEQCRPCIRPACKRCQRVDEVVLIELERLIAGVMNLNGPQVRPMPFPNHLRIKLLRWYVVNAGRRGQRLAAQVAQSRWLGICQSVVAQGFAPLPFSLFGGGKRSPQVTGSPLQYALRLRRWLDLGGLAQFGGITTQKLIPRQVRNSHALFGYLPSRKIRRHPACLNLARRHLIHRLDADIAVDQALPCQEHLIVMLSSSTKLL